MVQIVKRRKKGRPPKSDLARRSLAEEPELESRVRRSLRRRNVMYNFVDYDDFIDDDNYFEENECVEDEEEDEPRREKKVKLVVKLNQGMRCAHARGGGASYGEEDDDDDDRLRKMVVKKRRIGGGGEDEDEEEEEEFMKKKGINGRLEDEDEVENGERIGIDDAEERVHVEGDSKELDSPPGSPLRAASGVPLPDKKELELILDKLQKKDTYGVYGGPVDPEELPDYHDVIEHPMDFLTMRKKLANGLYSTLEQFESDVFLICSNAMQYNAQDTIYHKQARTIQELGRKKFQKLRTDYELSVRECKFEQKAKSDLDNSERELKSEQRMKYGALVKKQMKKPASRPFQEPVGSDFSAGVTLAIGGDLQNVSAADQVDNCEMPSINDGVLDGSPFFAESNLDKGEELSTGKCLPAKFWRKPSAVDKNRRATYIMSDHPALRVESIFTTFGSEIKQLVSVGLRAENSYARSLTRFAANLGPIAWKVASQRIEQVLPAGSKFGHGWVGEYEPLLTPILMPEKCLSKDYSPLTELEHSFDSRKGFKVPDPQKEDSVSNSAPEMKPAPSYQNNVSSLVNSSALRLDITSTANHQQPQSPVSGNPAGSSSKVIKQFELNSLPPTSQCNADYVGEKKHIDNPDKGALVPSDTILNNLNHLHKEVSAPDMVANSISSPQSVPFKQPDTGGVVGRGLSNGKIVSNGFDNIRLSSPSYGLPNEMRRPPAFFLRQDQGLSDPVQLMQMLAEKAQKQQNPPKHSGDNTPTLTPPVPSMRRDSSGNAATAAASVWMSIGGAGFKQTTENSSSPRNQIPATMDSPCSSTHYPVQMMRILAETTQKQQNPQKHSGDDRHAMATPVPSVIRDTSGSAATAAASVWMSIGGGGFKQSTQDASSPRNQIPTTTDSSYSSPRELHPSQMAWIHGEFPTSSGGTYFLRERVSSPLPPPFMQQQSPVSSAQFSNRPVVLPQLMNTNLARFQAKTPWRGIASHTQQRPKQEILPPDLNIGFQSPGSPGRQSSGVKMEQQPDLALQL